MIRRRIALVATVLAVPLSLTACAPKQLNQLTLPGGTATGDNGYTVTAYFLNTQNLVPNAQVLYNNKQVGTVRSISFHTGDKNEWQAKVRFSLLKDRPLPANVTLKIGQKSLLGAEYLEIDVPNKATIVDGGTLREHAADAITTARTGNYPETEQVLAGVTLLLGNGGLGQIKTITTEIDKLFKTPERRQAARDLLTQLQRFFGTLDGQKKQIIDLVRSIDGLGKVLSGQRQELARAIDHIDPGLRLLADQRAHLTSTLQSISRLSVAGKKIIGESGGSLIRNLQSLQPVLTALNQTGKNLPESLLLVAAFPFPLRTTLRAAKGDYANLFATLNLSLPVLAKDFGIPLDALGVLKQPSAALGSGDPRTLPLTVAQPGTTKTAPTTSGGAPTSAAPKSGSPTSGTPTPTPTPTKSGCNLITGLLGRC